MPITPGELRESLQQCLGGEWPTPGDLDPRVTDTTHLRGYRIEHLSYLAEPNDRVPALLLIPDGVDAAHPAPAIVALHQHNGEWNLGKSEPAGLAGNPMHHTGAALAREGYVVLCPDSLCFEDRASLHLPGHRDEQAQAMRYLTQGQSLAWKNILDTRRAVDLLASRPEVDATRLGAYGHSMGSTIAWLTGPFEPRLRAIVGNCCLPTYAAIEEHHLTHCFTTFVPGWQQHGDTPDIAGLIAPTPLHLNFGELDADSPLTGVLPGIDTIAKAFKAADAGDHFTSWVEPGAGHELTEAMWGHARDTFARYLAAGR
ncbi:MAG: hypothetical protein CVT64_05470 [Actinobacteria bacterium HGW-Actinobacteria-4]|nr:MAG: hypothetical protein CVT64_05470 [Actinobacteria bacterium HGW-Actinobacteria-4]